MSASLGALPVLEAGSLDADLASAVGGAPTGTAGLGGAAAAAPPETVVDLVPSAHLAELFAHVGAEDDTLISDLMCVTEQDLKDAMDKVGATGLARARLIKEVRTI